MDTTTVRNVGSALREQVCIYMCPYARFQSVMFDRDTLIISYDEKRGEPRGKRRLTLDSEIKTSSTGHIAFLLIIFFMLTATFAVTKGVITSYSIHYTKLYEYARGR